MPNMSVKDKITTQLSIVPVSENGVLRPGSTDIGPTDPNLSTRDTEARPGDDSNPSIWGKAPFDEEQGLPDKALEIVPPRPRHSSLKPFALLLGFWASGVGFSIGHCVFYKQQDGSIVGSSEEQENKIRVGTALAFLSQIALCAAVWAVYTQMVWMANLVTPGSKKGQGPPWTMNTLNKIFSADRSVWWMLSIAMLKTFTGGYIIAMFAWMLILPGFFTPGTLFVYHHSLTEIHYLSVPKLTINHPVLAHNYTYSPSYEGDIPENKNNVTKDFMGPRTIVTRITTSSAANGQILPIQPLFNISSYNITFNGPSIRCQDATPDTTSLIDSALAAHTQRAPAENRPNRTVYYAFVPSYDDQGNLVPLDTVRYQTSINATNELWLTFERYDLSQPGCQTKKYYQVCRLYNSTYDLALSWHNGVQTVTGAAHVLSHETVPYPRDTPPMVSDLVQHAYSAFFWALADQVTGSFVWYEKGSGSSPKGKGFGGIHSPIQHNVLLGSSDLNVFFDLNEKGDACRLAETAGDRQRRQDIALAGGGRRLAELIEEMGFNMTVSLLSNRLLTRNITTNVSITTPVNRYGYNTLGLLVPYGIACGLTTIAVGIGLALMIKFDPMPEREVEDILAALEPEVLRTITTRNGGVVKSAASSGTDGKQPPADQVHEGVRLGMVLVGERGQRRPSLVVSSQQVGGQREEDRNRRRTSSTTAVAAAAASSGGVSLSVAGLGQVENLRREERREWRRRETVA